MKRIIKIKHLVWGMVAHVLLFHMAMAQSQGTPDLSRALKIGDTFVPPAGTQVMRGEMEAIDWELLENKVIILDFFDTYCGTCIASMPHLQELQDKHSDKLQIFNVTWQDKKTLAKFFATNAFIKEHKVNLPVLYSDAALKSLFPYRAAPHIVMIYKGRVQAVTFNRLLTEENVLALYHAGTIDLPSKNDFGEALALSSSAGNAIGNIKAGAWITGYQNGVPTRSLTFERDTVNGLLKSTITNRSIYRSLVNTWAQIEPREYFVTNQRVEWKVKDSSVYKDFEQNGEGWDSKFAICYQRTDFVNRDNVSQAKVVLSDLHRFLGLKSYWKNKVMDCWIFRPCTPKSGEAKALENTMKFEGSNALARFIGITGRFPLVMDQAKIPEDILVGSFSGIEELNIQLQAYGIEVIQGEAEFEVFVVEEDGCQ
ncbi:TlpA family protein disulfide reductase [Sphingobacterium alkalisoli]|uniref:TlpA family protein disulfide reductase n=1 Tax=Sphingobacterium alkalisoli TaxID=1874115 RepID=A0A4U0H7S6_9SPHI|nr:TlpA disulfide reductase family protein [Sphingobacterium alkalisoli]TJY67915.1 TlpA family protein disulfide reductase [Sphingobacterium alkalisoli]